MPTQPKGRSVMEDNAASTTLEAGRYIVGDPCYSFDDRKVWSDLLQSGYDASDEINAWGSKDPRIMDCATADGKFSFVASGTDHGDGAYEDQDGRVYGVDSGMIGVVPATDATTDRAKYNGHSVQFDEPFQVSYSQGLIIVGHLIIDTRG